MLRGLVMFCLACSCIATLSSSEGIKPVRDNVGFCWTMHDMKALVAYLAGTAGTPVAKPGIVAAISPHDDYLYAGKVYYPLHRALRAKLVVIFGVTHSGVRKEIGDPHDVLIMDDFAAWPGLGRTVGVSPLRDYVKSHLAASDFITSNKAHGLEHSIEAELPFLSYDNPDVTIVPIMVTQMSWERMNTLSDDLSTVIAGYVQQHHLVPGRDIAFLMSSDANHYGEDFNNAPFGLDAKAHEQATAGDRRIAHECLDGAITSQKIQALTVQLKDVVWCGKFSVPFGLLTAQKTLAKVSQKGLEGAVLRYSDSYTEGVLPVKDTAMGVTAPATLRHWCGWLSAAYYLQ
jgi:AmmeMemoRadiSam system protein B